MSSQSDRAATGHTWGVLALRSGNFLGWHHNLEDADAEVARLRELNPDMPPEDVEVVEFDAEGMPV